jgi:hypothetical protein
VDSGARGPRPAPLQRKGIWPGSCGRRSTTHRFWVRRVPPRSGCSPSPERDVPDGSASFRGDGAGARADGGRGGLPARGPGTHSVSVPLLCVPVYVSYYLAWEGTGVRAGGIIIGGGAGSHRGYPLESTGRCGCAGCGAGGGVEIVGSSPALHFARSARLAGCPRSASHTPRFPHTLRSFSGLRPPHSLRSRFPLSSPRYGPSGCVPPLAPKDTLHSHRPLPPHHPALPRPTTRTTASPCRHDWVPSVGPPPPPPIMMPPALTPVPPPPCKIVTHIYWHAEQRYGHAVCPGSPGWQPPAPAICTCTSTVATKRSRPVGGIIALWRR